MKKDNAKLVKEMGISKELTEHTEVEARVYDDFSEYGWVIHIHPPTERKDLIYFKIYKGFQCPAEVGLWTASNCARISMLKPEYINCSDSSIKSWILNKDERNHLCSIISEIWDKLLFDYSRELTWLFGTDTELSLVMPDYSKLPINGHSSMGSWGMKKVVRLAYFCRVRL